MNNLKRILSLALAGVMTLGMMTVGASAAFTDAKDIENTAAVNTMASLGIINGIENEDGTTSFNPNGFVNRAQMAQMIAKALNGGKLPNYGLASNKIFSDVTPDGPYAAFAEAINYCANLGIVSGRGDGTFDPEANVTGWEAAKMMLVALGYEADVFGFTGSNWAANVNAFANGLYTGVTTTDANGNPTDGSQISLFDDIANCQPALPITRTQAAQLIYNGLLAHKLSKNFSGVSMGNVVYGYNKFANNILQDSFYATIKYGLMTEANYTTAGNAAGLWTYKIDGIEYYTSTDVSDLFGQNVQVIYRGNVSNVIAISAVNNYVTETKPLGKLNTNNGKLDGNVKDSDYTVYYLGSDTDLVNTLTTIKNTRPYYTYQLVDNDNDYIIDSIVITPVYVGQVIKIEDGKITVRESVSGTNKTYTFDAAEEKATTITATLTDKIVLGDYVTVIEPMNNENNPINKQTISKLELTDAMLVTAKDNATGTYTIGGTKYNMYNNASVEVGKSYKLGIVNGYVALALDASTDTAVTVDALSNILFIREVGTAVDEISNRDNGLSVEKHFAQRVSAIFPDGTTKVIMVEKHDTDGDNSYKTVKDTDASTQLSNTDNAGKFYNYTVENGVYTIGKQASLPTEGFATTALNATNIGNKINKGKGSVYGTITYDNDGIFIVKYNNTAGSDVWGAFTGKEINSWMGDANVSSAELLYKVDNKTGAKVAKFGTIVLSSNNGTTIDKLPGAVSRIGNFGYVVSNVSYEYNAEKKANEYKVTVWDGKENVTYAVYSRTVADDIKLNTAIEFTLLDNTITGVSELNAYGVSLIAGTAIGLDNGSKQIYTLANDTVIIYIDSSEKTGATSGSITLAQADPDSLTGQYFRNVYAKTAGNSAGDTVEVLFVEVDNVLSMNTRGNNLYTPAS